MKTQIYKSDLRVNSLGMPIIFSLFGGSHGYCGEYLTLDGLVCFPRMHGGPSFRDKRETDMVVTHGGEMASATDLL